MSVDQLWLKTLQILCDLMVMHNEIDASSNVYTRPTNTLWRRGMLVLKSEAKCDVTEIGNGVPVRNPIGNFHDCARLSFSADCPEVPGIATSMQGASIHRIYHTEGGFQEEHVMRYNFLSEQGRVEFICDILKIALWMTMQTKPIEQFHLPPDVRNSKQALCYPQERWFAERV